MRVFVRLEPVEATDMLRLACERHHARHMPTSHSIRYSISDLASRLCSGSDSAAVDSLAAPLVRAALTRKNECVEGAPREVVSQFEMPQLSLLLILAGRCVPDLCRHTDGYTGHLVRLGALLRVLELASADADVLFVSNQDLEALTIVQMALPGSLECVARMLSDPKRVRPSMEWLRSIWQSDLGADFRYPPVLPHIGGSSVRRRLRKWHVSVGNQAADQAATLHCLCRIGRALGALGLRGKAHEWAGSIEELRERVAHKVEEFGRSLLCSMGDSQNCQHASGLIGEERSIGPLGRLLAETANYGGATQWMQL